MDGFQHLAKVRVAGSNPVVRSKWQTGRRESGAQAAVSCGCRSSENTLGVAAVDRNPLVIRKMARQTSQAKTGTTHTPRL